jgi:hypothetical protein
MQCQFISGVHLRCIGIALLLSAVAGTVSGATKKKQTLPKFDKVAGLVQRHFASLPDYQTGDIIAKSDVQPIFKKIESLGWEVRDEKAILERVPAGQDFLVRQLRSKQGKDLMRQVSGYPLIYDRMDRISQQTGGEQLLRDLPKLPDAHKAVAHLVDFLPKTGSSRTPHVKDYDKATGRIYTQKQLLHQLEQAYQLAQQKAEK